MSDTRKKITSADTITLKSHVLPKGEARDRDFATAKPAGAPSGPSSYNFVLPNGATRADDAGSFFGPPSDFQAAMSGPVVQRIRAMSAPHPAQVYSYGNRDYASFADAEKANPNMAQISNPQSGEDLRKGYEMERGRAFVNSIGTGAVGLGPIAYNLGASPEVIQASGQLDEALGNLAGANALRSARVKYPSVNPSNPVGQPKAWPENDGFVYSVPNKLRSGEWVDRYGGEGSPFVAPVNTPFEARGIDPRKRTDGPHAYQILEDMDVRGGPALPWYGGGGGWQYKLPDDVENLIGKKLRRKS